MRHELEIGQMVRIKYDAIKHPSEEVEGFKGKTGRVVGAEWGDYKVLFEGAQDALWFRPEELEKA